MSYESTLRWYAEHDPRDFAGIEKLIAEEKANKTPANGDTLSSKRVALVIGHPPGEGARGEREWNIKTANRLAAKLNAEGAEVLTYPHKTSDYSKRCEEMRAAVMDQLPDSDCTILMHYNAYDDPDANGHEFHYRSSPALAGSIRDAWQAKFPSSRPRKDDGIFENRNKDGSGMIKAAPSACCLLEPFFISSPESADYVDTHDECADAYFEGIKNFLIK